MNFHKQAWFWIIVFAVFVSGAIFYFQDEDRDFFKSSSKDEVALTVNGTSVSEEDFLDYIEVVNEQQMMQGGMTEEEIMDAAVEVAVQKVVLSKLMDEKEISTEESEVESKYEEYEIYFQGDAPSFEELEDDLIYEVRIDKLISLYTEGDVSDEEVRAVYDGQAEQMEEMGAEYPPFEEVEEDIREYLLREKAISAIQEELDVLIEEAVVETFISIDDIELSEEEEDATVPQLEVEPEVGEEIEEEVEDQEETEEE
jgi:hypothetical protein